MNQIQQRRMAAPAGASPANDAALHDAAAARDACRWPSAGAFAPGAAAELSDEDYWRRLVERATD